MLPCGFVRVSWEAVACNEYINWLAKVAGEVILHLCVTATRVIFWPILRLETVAATGNVNDGIAGFDPFAQLLD